MADGCAVVPEGLRRNERNSTETRLRRRTNYTVTPTAPRSSDGIVLQREETCPVGERERGRPKPSKESSHPRDALNVSIKSRD